jgi:predicted nuclease of predicted toxin-antitoxin system
MRILADENISGAIVKLLRQHHHDVRWITESEAGIDDHSVWEIVKSDRRFLITSDKVFASFGMLQPEVKYLGLMLLRIPTLSADESALRVSTVISSQDIWQGKFCIVSAEGVRIRQL